MIKFVADEVWAFDAEWIPDVPTGRRVYNLGPEYSQSDVFDYMFAKGGATEEVPRPYLKTVLCRIVSIAALVRRKGRDGKITHQLLALPAYGQPAMAEADLIQRFLDGIGKAKPQLVGFNVLDADLPILVQRAVANGVVAQSFFERPDKPWDGRDYFVRSSDWMLDLRQVYGGFGRATPSLHELACAARIPGKVDVSGDLVLEMWLAGDIAKIVAYNEFDALTTFLLWLRTVRLAGLISTAEADAEETQLRGYLCRLIEEGREYLSRYLEKWDEVSSQ